MNHKVFFQYISYLQYPLIAVGVYFSVKPYFFGIEWLANNPEMVFESINSFLLFTGLAISFSSLQDPTKTQNNFSKSVWESPSKGKFFIAMLCFMIVFCLSLGLMGYYFAPDGIFKEVSVGTIVMGLGMLGMLKTALEMFEYHRKDT